jgi:hypothetical protein
VLRRFRRWFLHPVIESLEAFMTDVAALTQAVTDLEAQAAVNHQLLADLLAALQSPPGSVDQATIDALAARVAAVTAGEGADDAAAQAVLTPNSGDQAA